MKKAIVTGASGFIGSWYRCILSFSLGWNWWERSSGLSITAIKQ